MEPNTVAATLKRLWSEGKFSSKKVVIGVGNHRVLARDLTVQKMSLTRIRESLPFLVEEMIPVPVAEALLDFYPIAEVETEKGIEISGLLIAAVKEAVLGNVKAVQLAGLTPLDVDLIPFALSRSITDDPATSGSGSGSAAIAHIDVGAGTTTVVVTIAGVPQFIRLIPTGGQDLTQALAVRLGMDPAVAEERKRTLGLSKNNAQADDTEPIDLIREVTTELLNSLRNTVNYFTNTRHTTPVSAIVITGGGARLGGFTTALASLTRLPVTAPAAPTNLGYGKDVTAEAFSANHNDYFVALGLAMGAHS
jgi:type IV pilus assembly protein PilM